MGLRPKAIGCSILGCALVFGCDGDGEDGGEDGGSNNPATYCYGYERTGDEPWLQLWTHRSTGQEVDEGTVLRLTCGDQGSWMFWVAPRFGGFSPQGSLIHFDVAVSVQGFDINPDGYFFSRTSSPYTLDCGAGEANGGAELGILPFIPPDEIEDLTALHGLSAHVAVTLQVPDGDPVERHVTVELDVDPSQDWSVCDFF